MFYRAPHNYDYDAASDEAAIPADGHGESLTIQSQSEDADINVLMARFKVTGQMPSNVRVPTFGDFTGVKDYQSALTALADAQDSFMQMPANVRARFENNPQLFVEFCSDRGNLAEMRALGLAVPEEVPDVKSESKSNASS